MAPAVAQADDDPPPLTVKTVAATTIGHALEFYDYGLFASFSAVIAGVFFPTSSDLAGLMYTFAIYAVAYAARPLGAVFFGHVADRVGRRPALTTAIFLMTAATVVIGLTPSHAQIGGWAALILCVARLVQGVALGGELGGAMSFLVELAPSNRRGLYGSWQAFGAGLGLLGGALIGTLMTSILSTDALNSWGWRVAFLVAAPVGLVGLYLRLKVEESPYFTQLQSRGEVAKVPAIELLRSHWRQVAVGIGIVVLLTISTATWEVYMTAYLIKGVGMTPHAALGVFSVALIVYVVCIPAIGSLSDRIGRKPVMYAGAVGLTLLTLPGFLVLRSGNLGLIFPSVAVVFVVMACTTTIVPIVLAELFPTKVRSSGIGIAYAVTVAALGGTAPLVQTWLTERTGSALAPAYYVLAAGVLALVLLVTCVTETAPDQVAPSA